MLQPLLSLWGLPPPPRGSCSCLSLTPTHEVQFSPLPRTSFAPRLGFARSAFCPLPSWSALSFPSPLRSTFISKKTIYVRWTQPSSGRIASALCVLCALTVCRTFFLIPCAWCLPTPLSPLPCTQRACCGRPPSRHPPHHSPLLLLSSDGIRRTHPQFPAPRPPAPYLLPLAT